MMERRLDLERAEWTLTFPAQLPAGSEDWARDLTRASDAIVIERAELPYLTTTVGSVSAKAFTWSKSSDPDDLREVAACYLAAAEYLDAHPPVPPVSDEDVETLAGLLWEYAQNPSGPGDTFAETNEGEHNRFRNRARRLLATGRVSVTHA